MEYVSRKFYYNFPIDIINNINNIKNHIIICESKKLFLQDIKCSYLKYNSNKIYKLVIIELNNININININ